MKVLYLCYWGINEGITQSTVIQQIKILSELSSIKEIILITIERNKNKTTLSQLKKTFHHPLISKNFKISFLNKIHDFILFPREIIRVCKNHNIDVILARASPAGALAWKTYKKNKIPFCVESFEPHADYMFESGVWNRYSFKYIFQKHWEKKIKKHAKFLMPVSFN